MFSWQLNEIKLKLKIKIKTLEIIFKHGEFKQIKIK